MLRHVSGARVRRALKAAALVVAALGTALGLAVAAYLSGPAPPPPLPGSRAEADAIVRRRILAEQTDWPEDVKRDVTDGVVRVGFQEAQVRLAMWAETNPDGDPHLRRPLTLPDGRPADAMIYPAHTFVMQGGRVVQIQGPQLIEMEPYEPPPARPPPPHSQR